MPLCFKNVLQFCLFVFLIDLVTISLNFSLLYIVFFFSFISEGQFMLGVGFLVVVLFIQYLKNIFAFCLVFMVSDKKSIVILIVHHPSLLPSKFVVFNFQKFIRIYFRVDWFGVILFRICSASWIWLCICLLPNLGCFQPLMLFFWDFFHSTLFHFSF